MNFVHREHFVYVALVKHLNFYVQVYSMLSTLLSHVLNKILVH